MSDTRWHVFPDTEALTRAAFDFVSDRARAALRERGAFHIVLAGGTTPQAVYARLPGLDTDWEGWHIWFGDERCLPSEHADRNSRMAWEAWLGKVSIPAGQMHPMPAELGPEAAASRYAESLAHTGQFDLTLLGLGEDGHTASLFPGHEWGKEPAAAAVLPVHNAPKPPPDRVSLSASRLSDSRAVLFLVTGKSKRQAVAAWRRGLTIPAAAVRPAAGVDIFVEQTCLEEETS
jgi:6-phosphogluconolactonase